VQRRTESQDETIKTKACLRLMQVWGSRAPAEPEYVKHAWGNNDDGLYDRRVG
jgi:hypothetical protein